MKKLGDRVKELRDARQLSQKQLAKLAGITQPSLSDIESGKTKGEDLKAPTLLGLASGLKADPEYLLNGKGDPLQYQLIYVYKKLSHAGRDQLLGNANRILSSERPDDREADPYQQLAGQSKKK